MQLVAGVNLDSLLKKYVRREDEALFKQRVDLTQHIVTAVSKNLLDIFYKVPRSNSARRILTYKGTDVDTRVSEIENLLSKFWGTESWDDYLGVRTVELNATDPNSFVVLEWDAFDGENEMIQPRPYEVPSANAIDYKFKNKVLQYLIVKDKHMFKDEFPVAPEINKTLPDPKKGMKEGVKFTLYGPNQTFQLLEVSEKLLLPVTMQDGVPVTLGEGDEAKQYVKLGKKKYRYIIFPPHNTEEVPAFQVGYFRDLATNGHTYVNPLHAAEPYLLKTVKTNSELDLVATLLAFPQQIKYGVACKDDKCFGGVYHDGSTCKTCEGLGVATAPSSQDAIVIPMPRSKEEMVPLGELIKYVAPPTEVVEWQEQYIEKITQKAKSIMFNSDIFSKSEVAETATQKHLDMQNVYDTLYGFAVKFGKLWTFGVKTMAKLADREKDLVANYTFGKDFKLKSLDTLILDLQTANNIGNASLVKHLNDDIAEIIFSEKPIELQRYKMKEMYNPFSGKSEQEVLILLASPFVGLREKVLHANYGRVFDELELEFAAKKKDFYKLNRTDQRKAIYEKVDEIIKGIEEETPEPILILPE